MARGKLLNSHNIYKANNRYWREANRSIKKHYADVDKHNHDIIRLINIGRSYKHIANLLNLDLLRVVSYCSMINI
jgi:hypothetical protein